MLDASQGKFSIFNDQGISQGEDPMKRLLDFCFTRISGMDSCHQCR